MSILLQNRPITRNSDIEEELKKKIMNLEYELHNLKESNLNVHQIEKKQNVEVYDNTSEQIEHTIKLLQSSKLRHRIN